VGAICDKLSTTGKGDWRWISMRTWRTWSP